MTYWIYLFVDLKQFCTKLTLLFGVDTQANLIFFLVSIAQNFKILADLLKSMAGVRVAN